MNIESITVGAFQTNCFVVWSEPQHAVVIDPGSEAERIAEFLRGNGLTPACYLLTHGHMDHVSGVADLHDTMPAPVGIASVDLEWAFSVDNRMPPFYEPPRRPSETEIRLTEGENPLEKLGYECSVIATPGHTPGSVCLLFPQDKALFSGDTLFAGSVGRTDMPGGDSRTLNESLKKLTALPDDTVVYCGHGPSTTIGREKEVNYFVQRSGHLSG